MIYFLFFLVSLVVYWNTPSVYSWEFCLLCMAFYLVEAITALKKEVKSKQFLSFNLIFSFSFFWVSFAYAVLVYGTELEWLGTVSEYINWNYLSKACSASLLFYSSYLLVYKNSHIHNTEARNIHYTPNIISKATRALHITFFFFLVNTIYNIYQSGGHTISVDSFPYLFDLFYAALALYFIIYAAKPSQKRGHVLFVKENKIAIIYCVLSIILYLIIGDRGPVLRIFLIVGVIYYLYYKRISLIKILGVAVVGFFLMFFIRQTREYDETSLAHNGLSAITSSSEVLNVGGNFLYMFADLWGISHELTLECENFDTKGPYKPERIILVPFYPIPFLPTLVGNVLFGEDPNGFNTGAELNRQMSKYNTHFGNHIVGDIYMSYGAFGVIFFGFVLGYFVSLFTKRKDNSIYYRVIFIILMSLSLYLPRDSMFNLVRPISLAALLVYFTIGKNGVSYKTIGN